MIATLDAKRELAELLEEKYKRQQHNKIKEYFPDAGPLARYKYHKHTAFFEAGADHRERLMLAANRVGKTESVGAYELTCHLTGEYPEWWEGRRFDEPIKAWTCGDTNETVRDILQFKLLGPIDSIGTGMIPGRCIVKASHKPGVPDGVASVVVKHRSGGTSKLSFKSYDQKRKSFQGTEQDIIWLDEEPPLEIYTECLLRTMTNNGMIMCTFTPLLGMSDTILHFLPDGKADDETRVKNNRYIIMATWDDAPHLSKKEKEELWSSIPPYQRDARSKGVPQLGSGAIYPVPESDIEIDDFTIPDHWPRLYSLDVGWNNTAVAWAAKDPESKVIYIYSVYKRGQAEPSVHTQAITSRGDWIPGLIDPAARGRSQKDGTQLYQDYKDLGLKLHFANNAVEAGLYQVWQLLSSGKLKVFKSCRQWFEEFRMYRRDDKGKIVKDNDHLMDDTRYLVMGIDNAKTKPEERTISHAPRRGGGWMGR